MKTKFTQVEAMKSVRKSWDFNPAPRVVPSKKGYRRNDKHKGKSYDY